MMTPNQEMVCALLRRFPHGVTLKEMLEAIPEPERGARLTVGIMARCGQIRRNAARLWELGA